VILKASGVWVPQKDENGKDQCLPRKENIKVAVSAVCSISFMNLCLLTNTVAIYQICKFATIPCTLCLQYFVFNQHTNWRVLFSLVFILGGVGYSSFKGFQAGNLEFKGIAFAVLAVISTSVYRIWQGTKQKEFKVGPVDFQATLAGWQVCFGFFVAVFSEFLPSEQNTTVLVWFGNMHSFSPNLGATVLWILGVCVAALTVNFTSFGLIGKTGPVAYAVVGHAKTVLTIFLGIVMFPEQETVETIRSDVLGCGIALCGVVAYTHFEYCFKQKVPDWVELNLPCLVKNKIAPKELTQKVGDVC
jgi:solute carrier family 35 protein E3